MTDERDPEVAYARMRNVRVVGEPEPMIRVAGSPKLCFAHAMRLDLETRTVSCSKCDRPFEAFDALEYVSRDWGRYASNLQALRGQLDALRAEEKDLKRRVQNLRAQVKRREGKG